MSPIELSMDGFMRAMKHFLRVIDEVERSMKGFMLAIDGFERLMDDLERLIVASHEHGTPVLRCIPPWGPATTRLGV
jgi:hypothetical protein